MGFTAPPKPIPIGIRHVKDEKAETLEESWLKKKLRYYYFWLKIYIKAILQTVKQLVVK